MGVFILNMVFVYPSCSRLVPISVYIFDLMKLRLGFSAHREKRNRLSVLVSFSGQTYQLYGADLLLRQSLISCLAV